MKFKPTIIIIVLGLFLPLVVNAQIQPYFGGVAIGSAPPEGVHVSAFYIPMLGNQLNDPNGEAITSMDLGTGPLSTSFDLNLQALGIGCTWVSKYKILGGTYMAGAIQPYAAKHAVSFLATAADGSTIPLINQDAPGLFDLVISPFNLSWNKERWDAVAGIAINLPTGNIEGGAANRYCVIPNVAGTYYFDADRTFSISSKVSLELNGAQLAEGADLHVGDEMIVEWGIGKMAIPYGRFGIIGYSVFQLNEDTGADVTSTALHSAHSIGAEYMMFIPPINTGIMLKGVKGLAAKDAPSFSIFMVGLSKTFSSSK